MLSPQERSARIRINCAGYMKPEWCRRLVDVYGGAQETLGKTAFEIARDGAVALKSAEIFLRDALAAEPEKEIAETERLGGRIIFPQDGQYPERLKGMPDEPFLLYVKGGFDFSGPAVAIVGTRYPDAYGRRVCAALAGQLSRAGFAIASGLARGIDSVAHEAALKEKGRTWAVVGTGIAHCYPAENKMLESALLEQGGAVISEFPVNVGPVPYHFPRRNRIISVLSGATVVVQGDHKSGSLITARCALDQGREVMAVPGPVDSSRSDGPNRLLKDGAVLVRNARDVFDAYPAAELFGINLPEEGQEKGSLSGAQAALAGPDEKKVLECIGSGELSIDMISEKLGWDIPHTAGVLFELEIKSLVSSSAGLYSKV
ncbi:MAG: DNA-processing protein DprA [Elusimicrobiaceae bacterium]|jgi:DNA processing protein